MKRYISFLLICFTPLLLSNIAPSSWQLKKDDNGIQIYTRKIDGSNFKEYKAETFINASVDEVVHELLYRAPNYTASYEYGINYLVEEKVIGQRVYYAKHKMPWPLKDRDVVSTIEVIHKNASSAKIEIRATPEKFMYDENVIRIKDIKGYWLIERFGKGVKLTQQLHLDPRGNIPAFVSNSFILKGPFKLFSELKSKLDSI